MCSQICGSADIPERLKGKVYVGSVLVFLLYGCESWCLTAESVRRLSNFHMCQTFVHRITSESLQKRTGVFALEHYPASRTLLWQGTWRACPRTASPCPSCSPGYESPVSPAAKR